MGCTALVSHPLAFVSSWTILVSYASIFELSSDPFLPLISDLVGFLSDKVANLSFLVGVFMLGFLSI